MPRVQQVLLIAGTLALSWLLMMIVHELGHVLHAWLSGGTVAKVVLHPLAISRTDVTPNPRPLFVAWGGALWGSGLPVVAWMLTRKAAPRFGYLARFFAGFCLVANGVYLAVGSVARIGDAADLLNHGAAGWQLIAFGVPSIVVGLLLWHNLGSHFGVGRNARTVDPLALWSVIVALSVIVLTEVLFGG